ncbi:MAG: O-antigen ligase family protein [Nitrospinaceae bacterium]|nr:O-antigen ligase family protein [Nitrospina sp.]MBT5869494.1 O-antigen ligase family protein [Nitrospinaceae bacterium]MBT6345161.1 O-antigen ligase family protein [Nitrospina sp.]
MPEKFLPDNNVPISNRAVPILDKLIQISLYAFAAFSLFSISITQISFSLGALAWLIKAHITQTWKEMRGTRVGIAILCFCLACILATLTSIDLENSIKHLKKLLQFVIFFWVANTVRDEEQKDWLIKLLIIAGTIAAFNGFLPAWDTAITNQNRVSGTMSHFMTFAGILMLTGLMASGRFLFHEPKEYWVLGAVGTIGFCLLLTLTRQAWLGFLVGAIFLTFFWNKKYLLALPIALIGLLLFAPEGVKDRLYSLSDTRDWTFQVRIFLWKGAWEIFKDHPITGCGFKCVDTIHSQYPDPSGYIALFRGLHSNVFQLLVDTGALGVLTWLSIWVTYFITLYKKWAQFPDANTRSLILGSTAAILGFLAGGLFEVNFYDSEVAMLLYFIMGLSLAQTHKKSPE